jgi:AcrR family transcriptional regulator
VLARDGFGAIGINAVAREAGVDKVLIYRYFGGLPELLPPGAQRPLLARGAGPAGRRPAGAAGAAAGRALRALLRALRARAAARPLTLEILAAEVQERNELTAILEAEREQWGDESRVCWAAPSCRRGPSCTA